MKKPIIVIAGPTASGKTSLAITLSKKFSGEIINADSRSIYREMNIATSKPTTQERQEIPHHLIDIVNPNDSFSLSDYKKLANKTITEIHNRNKIPFLVGGTGLYIDAVIYNYNLMEIKPNLTLRKKIEKLTTVELANLLESMDPISSKNIDQKNNRRLIRAIEVASQSDKPALSTQTKNKKPSNVLYLVLDIPRDILYEKISHRINQWYHQGLVNEAKKIASKYSIDLPSMSAIGYQEIADFLNNKASLSEALQIMERRTRHYAKRQLTWFKKNKDIIYIKNEKEATKKIEDFLRLT